MSAKYLDSKSKSEKAKLFSGARKERKGYVQEAKSNEVDVSIQIKEKKIEIAATNLVKHGELMRWVEEYENCEAVTKLLEKLSMSKSSKKQTL